MSNQESNGKPDRAPWNCDASGHVWSGTRAGPAPFLCLHCPAIGAECPDCRPSASSSSVGCTRCGESGRVELVEITRAQVEELRRDRRRLEHVLGDYAAQNDERRDVVLREVDELIAIGADITATMKSVGRQVEKVRRANKKPPTA